MADELGRPPAIFQVSDDAAPLESNDRDDTRARNKQSSAQWVGDTSPTVANSANSWKLRWRTPNVVSPPSASEMRPLAVSRAVAWSQTTSFGSSAVRTASQQTPVDPFAEPAPVQNRSSQNSSTLGQPQNRTQPRPAPDLNDPFIDPPPRPVPSDPAPMPSPMTPELPTPQTPSTPMPEPDLAPTPPLGMGGTDSLLGPTRDEAPCDRTYNDRNCCADEAKCDLAQRFVANNKITSIPLDITPLFTNTEGPSSATYVATEVRKEQELAKAPSRVWKNRSGRTVAEGRLTDYHNGHVHVLGSDGKTVKILFNTLSDDDVCFLTAWWSLPTECSLADERYQSRNWLASTLMWKASALCHKPLYFEEVALERYGHSVGPIKQPFVSGAHFFGSVLTLPFQMGVHPPHECQYALGYYRPGSCAPWLVPPVPISTRGALAAAGVWVGGIYIIP